MERKIIYLERTGSTNEDAKRLGAEGAKEGTIVVADCQESGKGRRGRNWVSPPGTNLYFTLLLKPEFAPEQASMLTLIMALSVAQALKQEAAVNPGIKWPNDIVLGQKKVCGMLTELTMEAGRIQSVVIGVGINVYQTEFPEEIRSTATSLALEGAEQMERMDLLNVIMNCFEANYQIFLENGNLSGLKDDYESFLVNRGKEVRVLDPAGEYTGTALGIDDKGELLVKLCDGRIERVYAGEVSVRGIYGYV